MVGTNRAEEGQKCEEQKNADNSKKKWWTRQLDPTKKFLEELSFPPPKFPDPEQALIRTDNVLGPFIYSEDGILLSRISLEHRIWMEITPVIALGWVASKKPGELGRISLVNEFGYCFYDQLLILETDSHRANTRSSAELVIIDKARTQMKNLLQGRLLVGYNLRSKLEFLKVSHGKRFRRDVGSYWFKVLRLCSRPWKVDQFAEKVLGVQLPCREFTCIEQAQAAMALYQLRRSDWEVELSVIAEKKAQKRGIKLETKKAILTSNDNPPPEGRDDEVLTTVKPGLERADMNCKLEPENYEAISDLATALKESLWNEGEGTWIKSDEKYKQCVNYYRKAIRIASEQKDQLAKGFIWELRVELGEILVFGKYHLLNQDLGKMLLDECERDAPNSAWLLQIRGKLYHYGAYSSHRFRDLQLAQEYYSRALSLAPQNFECLMEYLNLMKEEATRESIPLQREQVFKKILAVLNKSLEVIQDWNYEDELAILLTIKGIILWSFNPDKIPYNQMEAVLLWTEVLKMFPDHRSDKLIEMIRNSPFMLDQDIVHVHIPDVVHILERLAVEYRVVRQDVEVARAMHIFIAKLL